MAKHKASDTETTSAKRQKTSSEKDAFTSTEFRKMFTATGVDTKAMQAFQKFNKACANHKKNTEEHHDIVKAYIVLSPDCLEIFRFLRKGKPSVNEVSSMFSSFLVKSWRGFVRFCTMHPYIH